MCFLKWGSKIGKEYFWRQITKLLANTCISRELRETERGRDLRLSCKREGRSSQSHRRLRRAVYSHHVSAVISPLVWVCLFFLLCFSNLRASLCLNLIVWFNFWDHPMYENCGGLGRVDCGKMAIWSKTDFVVLLRMLYSCLMKWLRGIYGQCSNGVW